MGNLRAFFAVALFSLCSVAHGQSRVPDRQIPPSVINEVRLLENRFDIALAVDCDAERCFSKGCTYVDHAVADRPRSTSLPGLGEVSGPGSVASQEYLTAARCSFAYEESVESGDVQALSRRLQSKLSKGWTVVSVDHQRLQPLPEYLREAPEPEQDLEEETEEEPEAEEPPDWTATAARELWTSLLPHFFWMIAILLITLAGTLLIWAWRRVGRASIEEQMLLAELTRGEGGGEPDPVEPGPSEALDAETFVAQQSAAWRTRLQAMDPEHPDPEIQALVRALLRAGDLPLLAKAVLRFPERLPGAFPDGGEVAAAKLDLADYLKTVDVDALPSDVDFFRSLNRHALSATVASQSDAQIVRSIREDFGASGLANLIGRLPARPGALLFALASAEDQREMVRLSEPRKVAEMAEMLLRSNRMDAAETEHLFGVLTAARGDAPLPEAPQTRDVADRGAEFDAVGALSILLESVNPERRAALFSRALERYQGGLPTWVRGILVAEMLFELTDEARADLLLEVEVEVLAAWLSLLDAETARRIGVGLPDTLQASLSAASVFPSRTRQVALAEQGRRALAQGFQLQLARAQIPFEAVVGPRAKGDP